MNKKTENISNYLNNRPFKVLDTTMIASINNFNKNIRKFYNNYKKLKILFSSENSENNETPFTAYIIDIKDYKLKIYVPKLDIPYYSYKFLKNRIFKNKLKNRMNFWGPRFIEENRLAGKSIEEISAEQWVCCVKAAKGSLLKISGERVFHLTYENFVSNPKTILRELIDFIGIELNENFLMPEIKKSSVGKGARNLKKKQKLIINKIINEASLNNV